jgi:hypothetical protein
MNVLGIHLRLLVGPTIPIPATPDLINSVKSIEVSNADVDKDGFEIIFNVGRSGIKDLFDYSHQINPLLKPGNRVIIQVMFGVKPTTLIDGIIRHQQLNPSNSSNQSTLTVTGEDISILMDKTEVSEPHPNLPDSGAITTIISRYTTNGILPEVVVPTLEEVTPETDRTPIQRGTDLKYLKDLAARYSHVFYIEPSEIPLFTTAYWGPPKILAMAQKPLSFNLGSSTNVENINFQYNALRPRQIRGYVMDRISGMEIPIVTVSSIRPPLSAQPAIIANQSHTQTRQITPEGGSSALQAQNQAQTETEDSVNVVNVTGDLDALKYGDVLRARTIVELRGVGFSHDGRYYVKSVTHKIEPGSYKQNFTLTREGLGSTIPRVN